MAGNFNSSTGQSFTAVDFQIVTPAVTTESFSGRVRRIAQGHQYYTFGVQFPPMTSYQFGPVAAFIARQFGQVDSWTIQLPELSYNTGQNSAFIGSPTVSGYYTDPTNLATFTAATAPAGTKSVRISGMTASKTQVLRAGDYFKFDNHTKVYMAVGDLNSDASGQGILTFAGGLVSTVPLTTVLTHDAVPFTVILDGDVQEYSVGLGGMTSFSFKCREVW